LRVPAQHASLRLVRSELEAALARMGWPHDATGRAVLATGEAVANAIEHGSDPGEPVHIDLHSCEDWTTIVVRDQGRDDAAVPAVIPTTPPPASQPRGRGLVIMRRLADEIDVSPIGGGTAVRMRFAHPEAAPGR